MKKKKHKGIALAITIIAFSALIIYFFYTRAMNEGEKINAIIAAFTLFAVLAAIFQNLIHQWLNGPNLTLTFKASPPDCSISPLTEEQIKELFQARQWRLSAEYNARQLTPALSTDSTVVTPVINNDEWYDERFKELRQQRLDYKFSSFYFRLRVSNSGGGAAENVEVFLKSLEEKSKGKYCRVETFVPVNLTWTHTDQMYLGNLPQDIEKTCELGFVMDPDELSSDFRKTLKLQKGQTALFLSVSHRRELPPYVLPQGEYRLTAVIVASNSKPKHYQFEINVIGRWSSDPAEFTEKCVVIKAIS